tara:strand:- start:164 stop:2605 length:2442 start_codon:yes stop_codon:yes gene_type:complete
MKKYSFLITIFLLLVVFISYDYNFIDYPTPTEFIQKKNDRKKIKEGRKKWISDMHKTDPSIDWKSVDRENRKKNTDIIISAREKLLLNQDFRDIEDNYEVILDREIEGTWVERGSNNLAGRIRTADIDFENDIIYCASSGGNIWKGSVDGQNWESLNDYMQILGITFLRVVNTSSGQRLLIGSENNGFYYSDNDCITLNEASGLSGNYVKRFIMQNDSNNIYALVGTYPLSIYISEDLGESFQLLVTLDGNQGINSQQISRFDIFTPRYFQESIYLINDMILYEVSGNNIFPISTISSDSYSGDVLLTGGIGVGGTFLYAYIDQQLYHSIDGGVSWQYKGQTPSSWWWINGFNSSNIERDKVYIGGMELFESSNSGYDFSLVNPWWEYYDNIESKLHADIPEIRFYLDEEFNEIALISTDGGLYISDDYLNSVQNISMSGLGVSQYYSTYSQKFFPYKIFAGSQDQGLQKSIDSSSEIRDFEQIISGDYGHLVSGDNGVSIWANYPGFTIYYPDIANSNLSNSLDFPGDGYLWIPPLMENPYFPNRAFLGGGGISGGNHIIELSIQNNQIVYNQQNFNFLGTISAMAYSPIDPSYRYVLTTNGKFYYSNDNGQNWTLTQGFTGPDSHYFYGSTILASPSNLGQVFIGGSGYSNSPIYQSDNHGISFSAMNDGFPNTLVFQLASTPDNSILFAATEVGPYAYSFNQSEWFFLSGVSGPDQTYWTVDFIPELNTARFGTYGRGIWDFILNENYNIILGDINQDDNVNIQDIIIAISFVLETSIPNSYQFLSSDINQDNIINVLDIVLIVDIIFER